MFFLRSSSGELCCNPLDPCGFIENPRLKWAIQSKQTALSQKQEEIDIIILKYTLLSVFIQIKQQKALKRL